jgi:hypothetical protein
MNFVITGKKGFRITFPNGYSLSVQFGPGNYCDNYDMEIMTEAEQAGARGSNTAETAIIQPESEGGGLISDPKDGEDADTVQGYQTIEQVMDRMMRVYSWPAPSSTDAAVSEG